MRIAKNFLGFATLYINLANLSDPFLLDNVSPREALLKAVPVGGTIYYQNKAEMQFVKDEIGGFEDAYDPTEEMDKNIDAMLAGRKIEVDNFDKTYGLDEDEIEPDMSPVEHTTEMFLYEDYSGPTYSIGQTDELIPSVYPSPSLEAVVENILQPKLEEKFDASITKEIEVRKENKLCGRAELSQRHLRKKKGLSYYRYGAVQ